MTRVKFRKGQQRRFLQEVIISLNSPSLRALSQFGFNANYQTLKSYFNESRTLPEDLFNDLCDISKTNKNQLKVVFLKENWGQVKGGKH